MAEEKETLPKMQERLSDIFNRPIGLIKQVFPQERYDDLHDYLRRYDKNAQSLGGFGTITALWCVATGVSYGQAPPVLTGMFAVLTLALATASLNYYLKKRTVKHEILEEIRRGENESRLGNKLQMP